MNNFNLIDEPWIPIADVGLVSLKQIFTEPNYRALGGNPIQKIAMTKLLLAISQAACTPEDNAEWKEFGAEGLAQKCLAYLEKWHDRFYLFGEQPFLQMPEIANAAKQNFGAVLPEIATGNTTVLNSIQIENQLSDADKAMLIVQLVNFGLGGKKTDNSIVLSAGYQGKSNDKGKPSTGKAGTSLGFMGFLHNFLIGETLLQTLWLNLLTQEQIDDLPYSQKLGVAPWEQMPAGENCDIAKQLQNSLMGRLISMSRFCLFNDNGLHYSEGIAHLSYKENLIAPSVAANFSGKDAKVLWVDTERRPWRFLTALLSFMEKNGGSGFDCYYLKLGLLRARKARLAKIGVWSGGLRVSSNAGEQYVSGSDDFVDSVVFMDSDQLGEMWYSRLKHEMSELEQVSKFVYGSTMGYFKSQKSEGKNEAAQATHLFWQLCERRFQDLVYACEDESSESRNTLRKQFANFAMTSYNRYCHQDTAKQLNAWAANLPNFGKYLKDTKQQEVEA
jgi:CRISPR system Cascade subunit CasA